MGFDLDSAVIAADGGGTKSRMALVSGENCVEAALGAANTTTDFTAAAHTLIAGISSLASQAGLPVKALTPLPAYFGLAGIVGGSDAHRLCTAMPLGNLVVEDDRRAAVKGALGSGDGAVAGLGTGSFFGVQCGGAIRLSGGWGARLGDEASGFWIARKALSATLTAHDGLAPHSDLTRALLDRFDTSPRQIVDFGFSASPGDFAALAPDIIAAAQNGDETARRIMTKGAAHITDTLRRMGRPDDMALCLVGGVASHYAPYLPDDLPLTDAAGTALDGAIALARSLPRMPAP